MFRFFLEILMKSEETPREIIKKSYWKTWPSGFIKKIIKLLYFEWSPPWHFKTTTLDFMSAWSYQVRVDIQLISWHVTGYSQLHRLTGGNLLTYLLTPDILSDISSDIHRTFFLAYLLTFCVAFSLTYLLTLCLTYLVTLFLTYPLGPASASLSVDFQELFETIS